MQDAVAWYGAIVATASMVVAIIAWRSEGPRVKAAAVLLDGSKGRKLGVVVDNTGRSDVSLQSVHIWLKDSGELIPVGVRAARERSDRMHLELDGPELPHRLLAHSSATWEGSPKNLDDHLGHEFGRGDKAVVAVFTAQGIVEGKVEVPDFQPPAIIRWMETTEKRLEPVNERVEGWFRRYDEWLDRKFPPPRR